MELIRWFGEDEIPEEEQREIEIQMVEDYANELRGRAKRLGGGRDSWREPPGGLTVSQYDNDLRRACKTCVECQASQECWLCSPYGRFQPQRVEKRVRFTDVDWVTIPAREEKKEKAEFWDATEGWLEEELVEGIFCDALDHFFFAKAPTASRYKEDGSEISWTRR